MKKVLMLVVALLATGPAARADAPKGYDDPVLMVADDTGYGSGVAFHNGDTEFVWTAAHVVGTEDAVMNLVRLRVVDGRVAYTKMEGRVVRFSKDYDLAVVKSESPVCPAGALFSDEPPRVGQEVYHVGSPAGERGYNSYIPGTVAAIDRPTRDGRNDPTDPALFMDQYNLNISNGSSGGPVFDAKTRRVMGLTTLANPKQQTICLAVPTRVIKKFAKESDCLWAVDPSVPVPAEYR
jgi:S1-C subfamily serine protease